MDDIINQHAKIAVQVSGGKDSIATLLVLKPYWHKSVVYWLDTGDCFPETLAIIEKIKAMVPHFVQIKSNSKAVRQQFGMPSDIVPAHTTGFGRMVEQLDGVHIQDRYQCCAMSIMSPLHQRMIDDGVTLIARGQKRADKLKGPLKSGDISDGFQFVYPIEDWTDEQVIDLVREHGLLAKWYEEGLTSSPDCMGCTAWWNEGRSVYLAKYHKEAYLNYTEAKTVILSECTRVFTDLERDENGV